MALKRENNLMAVFSMASLTDVIFLLLIFFMVTSTYVFPTALEINLPQSTEQTSVKPALSISYTADSQIYANLGDEQPQLVNSLEDLEIWLRQNISQNPGEAVTLRADESILYGKVVEIINVGARANVKIVLATKASSAPAPPTADNTETTEPQL